MKTSQVVIAFNTCSADKAQERDKRESCDHAGTCAANGNHCQQVEMPPTQDVISEVNKHEKKRGLYIS